MGTALTAAVGRTIGRGRKDLAMKQTSVCLRVSMIYMGLVGICFFVFRNALMRFWSTDTQVIHAGIEILICAAIYQAFHAARTIYSGSLRGAGDTVWLAIISAVGAVVILGLGGAMMAWLFPGLEALGPWIAATASIILVGLANRRRFKSNKWMDINLFERRGAGVPFRDGTGVQ